MKRLAMALLLACAFSGIALAGDIPSTGAPAPGITQCPPAPSPGDMGNGGDQTNGGRTDNDGDQGAGGLALIILDLFF